MNKKIAILSAAFALTVPITPVFAQVADPTTTTQDQTNSPTVNREQMRAELQAQRTANQQLREQNQTERTQLNQQASADRQQNIQDHCQNIEKRIETQTNRYENNKQMFLTVFGNMKARLERLSERLASKGIDVTKLNQDIQTLDTKIAKLTQDHDTFIAGLKDVQASAPTACGTSKGEFMGKLLGSRKVSLTVEQDRLDIRSFFQTTIRPDILAIRKQLESQKTTASTTPVTTTTTAATPTTPTL